jgi:type III secretory pathway component EscV
MAHEMTEPQVLQEPGAAESFDKKSIWMRGLWMLVLAILFGFAEALLVLLAVIQFLWMLFGKEKNQPIADFGTDLADWLARVAKFQTAETEERPFPFAKWGPAEK